MFVTAEPGKTAFYAWRDAPDARTVGYHADPAEAIRSGLRQAGWHDP